MPDLHHKNQDPSDNRKANIIVLCPNCHRKAHMNDKTPKTSGKKSGSGGEKGKGNSDDLPPGLKSLMGI